MLVLSLQMQGNQSLWPMWWQPQRRTSSSSSIHSYVLCAVPYTYTHPYAGTSTISLFESVASLFFIILFRFFLKLQNYLKLSLTRIMCELWNSDKRISIERRWQVFVVIVGFFVVPVFLSSKAKETERRRERGREQRTSHDPLAVCVQFKTIVKHCVRLHLYN